MNEEDMYSFETLDVFTTVPFGGNPLAVFPEAERIPENLYQRIAREMNLSETVFVLPGDDASHQYRFRIFTPARELDFAGHPVVGTACALAARQDAKDFSFQARLNVGIASIDVHKEGSLWKASFQVPSMPQAGPPPPEKELLAQCLSLELADLISQDPEAYSCGAPFLFVELASKEALSRCRLDLPLCEEHLINYWAPEIMPFFVEGTNIHSRMFAPRLGISEDPATGGAAAALAGYLFRKFKSEISESRWNWQIHQGYDMGRPSLIEMQMQIEKETLKGIRITGSSVPMLSGHLRPNKR
ncbi:MAG: hypothetical protein CMN77_17505 [Spirochaetaceae bacterium]|nr:hypothetical protein [Spirochaetaceae bacterium]|tara:strand:+ start:35562 stop:36464 length:903 start_codon:yes stop_codon:yes gene_type:complete